MTKKFPGSDVVLYSWYFLTGFPRWWWRRREQQLRQVIQNETGLLRKCHYTLTTGLQKPETIKDILQVSKRKYSYEKRVLFSL